MSAPLRATTQHIFCDVVFQLWKDGIAQADIECFSSGKDSEAFLVADRDLNRSLPA